VVDTEGFLGDLQTTERFIHAVVLRIDPTDSQWATRRGLGPASVEFGAPLYVGAEGDIYLGTEGRGVILLKKTR
jgi:hypothetical protein